MKKSVSNSVVVITGASSGIGHAAALEFARRQANVVLAARREAVLKKVAAECREKGAASALVVPTDVTDEQAVNELALKAYGMFGRIDTWVNNAAVSMFSRFEESPPDTYRRVIDTNLFGYIHGARAVLPYFREQGEGTLINVSSIVANAPQPYTSAYVTSKYAINGLTECLRMELELDEAPNINVCVIMPASIDTPIFQNAANYTGRAAQPLNPVYTAEKVGNAIAAVAANPKRKTIVGEAGRLFILEHALAPRLYERIGARIVERDHLKREPAIPTGGNVFEPSGYQGISGGWRRERMRPVQARIATIAAVGAGLGLLWFVGRKIMRAKR